jgi:hypothetical protein
MQLQACARTPVAPRAAAAAPPPLGARLRRAAAAAAAALVVGAAGAAGAATCPELSTAPSGLQWCDVVEGTGAAPVKVSSLVAAIALAGVAPGFPADLLSAARRAPPFALITRAASTRP